MDRHVMIIYMNLIRSGREDRSMRKSTMLCLPACLLAAESVFLIPFASRNYSGRLFGVDIYFEGEKFHGQVCNCMSSLWKVC